MGMCKPSGGIKKVVDRFGTLPRRDTPNTRTDLYDKNGNLIQQRWYGPDGWVVWNRDYNHEGEYKNLPDHRWIWDDIKGPQREKSHLPKNDNYC